MTITLKEFNKFANENDISWFYNKPRWGIVSGAGLGDSWVYKKFINKPFWENDDLDNGNLKLAKLYHNNYLYAIFGTPEEREKEREKLLNKKELQMCRTEDKPDREQKHAAIIIFTDKLRDTVRKLEGLTNDVEGVPSDQPDNQVDEKVSLSAFLVEHPKVLENLNERILIAISKLRELLF